MKKYYLLLWPESQEWIGHPEAICAGYDYSEDDDLSLDQALFIPCDVYDKRNNIEEYSIAPDDADDYNN